jgi:hypothetical protein
MLRWTASISKCWLVSKHLLLSDFRPYVIIFMNVWVVITVAMVMLLRNFGSYGDHFLKLLLSVIIISI